jgi:hypothetical protein
VKSVFNNTNPIISVIAVIGPVTIEGKKYRQALWAEIGIGRGTPYSGAEKTSGGQRDRVQPRQPMKVWTTEEEVRILPTLEATLQQITDVASDSWKYGVGWYKNRKENPKLLLPGKFFTIPYNMPFTTHAVYENDLKKRIQGHVREFIHHTKLRLHACKYATYPDWQLRRLKAVKDIAANLGEARYGESILEHIKIKLGNPGTKERQLFEQILEVWKISAEKEKDTQLIALREQFQEIAPPKLSVHVAIHYKRKERRERQATSYPKGKATYRHASKHLRFEVKVSAHKARYKQPPA